MTDYAPAKGMTDAAIDAAIDRVLADATLAEKVGMMSGHGFVEALRRDGVWGGSPYRAGGGIERLGVPCFWFTDGPRGVGRGSSTCFPVTMARGASFDVDLERRIGEIMAVEARAQGCNLSGAVCINLLRHPAWGRAQETYGEDSYHLGAMGAALAAGLQAHNVCATVKHFALNSMENMRFKVDVVVDERTLHEVYLPHFKAVIDVGAMSVMSAYNKVNGEYCGQHAGLLTDILRTEWGFAGWVHSDWFFGAYQPYAATAGLDVENPRAAVFGNRLIAAVESGAVAPSVIDRACRRVLTVLYRQTAAQDPLPDYPVAMVASEGHVAVAREAAEKSAVLLKNDAVLPLGAGIGTLAVLGRLAQEAHTGDRGSSRVAARHVVTPLAGLRAHLGSDGVLLTADESDLAAVRDVCARADAIVVVAGLTWREEGEFIPGGSDMGLIDGADDDAKAAHAQNARSSVGGDRADLDLPADQIALIEAAAASGRPLVVVLQGGSAIMVERWHAHAGAILQVFYAGMEGGTALANLLFGVVSPSGRLPFTVARDLGDYPAFDRHATHVVYDYWHGYAKLLHEAKTPRFAFGHGLGYTRFVHRALRVAAKPDRIEIEVAVTNVGERAGSEVVFAFIRFPGSIAPRPARSLKGFARLDLAPGATCMARISIAVDALRYRDPHTHGWRIEPGVHHVVIARDAHADGLEASFVL